jgi:prepilin-type N-terminal cleavage/methylation domain-containing protein
MRSAFTLVELLVVLAILTVIMGVVVPQGAKMLGGYQRTIARLAAENNLSVMRARSFIELREYNVTVDGRLYRILPKGVVLAPGDDHR